MNTTEKDKCFGEILDIIHRKCRLDCRQYNESYIKRRLNARIMANSLNIDDYFSYIKILATSNEELRCLYDALTINVTQFFRDNKFWELIAKDILPKMLLEKRSKGEKTLSIWSCGCSSGEEPYSLAMLLRELAGYKKDINIFITGTDIDERSLSKAKAGIYDLNALKNVPKEYLLKYFRTAKSGDQIKYEVDPTIRTMVHLKSHNFLNEPPPAREFDAIFCRNVMIYFTLPAKDKLMNTFYETLSHHGWLMLGKSEVLFTLKMQQHFYLYNVEERVYRKERRRNKMKVENERRKNWWWGYGDEKSNQ
ncbi:MAG: protein-glutamate O-methyltransferase CheR [Endomicrobiales bacterium]|nr:protein-glutamate O-methyltransferase CheR [Endomicrobiales bacterium]